MFYTRYGEKTAKAIISTAGIKFVLANGDPDSANYLSNLLSKSEEVRYNESIQERQGAHGSTSQGISEQKAETALFTASQIQNLPDLNVIIKQKNCPVTKTELKVQDVDFISMPLALRDESKINRNKQSALKSKHQASVPKKPADSSVSEVEEKKGEDARKVSSGNRRRSVKKNPSPEQKTLL